MPLLGGGELELRDDPASLGWVVILDCRLQVLAEWLRLAELPA